MAYKKYTSKKITENLGLKRQPIHLFDKALIPIMQPSLRLNLALELATQMSITTEKAVCEYIVSPILSEIKILK